MSSLLKFRDESLLDIESLSEVRNFTKSFKETQNQLITLKMFGGFRHRGEQGQSRIRVDEVTSFASISRLEVHRGTLALLMKVDTLLFFVWVETIQRLVRFN